MDAMTDAEREQFAAFVAQKERGAGSARAAYRAAGLSAQTWQRVVDGESVKPFTITAVVNAFWPEAQGDWRKALTLAQAEETPARATIEELLARIEKLERKVFGTASVVELDTARARRAETFDEEAEGHLHAATNYEESAPDNP